MRGHSRTVIVVALALALLAVFLRNVDLRGVVGQIVDARPLWLALSLTSMVVNLAIRAWRWQYLLEPLGAAPFGTSFRATAVGFAANALLPARAGEVIRPYFLARQARMSATGAFATIILERLLDTVTVLGLLAVYVFAFARGLDVSNPVAFAAVKWSGITAGAGALAALAVLFAMAGDPARLGRTMTRIGQVLPSKFAALVGRVAEKFAVGLGAIRSPRRLAVSLLLSIPLWLCIAFGTWAAAVGFTIDVPFTGSFLLTALLVIGVAVPTPGAVGGFHEMFRLGATTFFGAGNDAAVGAAIVLHLFAIGPSLLLGLLFAAQEGLSVGGMRQLADRAERQPSTPLP